MGLLDYYRQFEEVDEEELNVARRERRRREKELALQEVPELDLSGTEWPDMPNSEVVNASIYTARGRVNGYPDRHAEDVRRMLAERHEVEPEQIAVGNGAAELLQSAALALLSEGDELVMPWPSYPLYPLMATRAGARPVAVDHLEDLRGAVGDRTRVVVICNPNDPTGTYLAAEEVGALAAGLPREVHVLVDEALVHFQDVEPIDSVLRLTDAFPNLLVFRTFSKAYGLSGLRAGYAVGSTSATRTLDAIAPVLGVNALTQAALAQTLKIGGPEVERRRASVIKERTRLLDALRELPVDVSDSQANFIWLAARGVSGNELTARLGNQGVIVAAGGPLGADDHIRAAIRNSGATDRLLNALERALA
ncbi:MAG TPA: aminotransferase class I/II-fold pyridoxal phosphate-dependent enzyme [Thermoleophilaceae bacterium]|jgi:histidinol-phosphate aminotransferase